MLNAVKSFGVTVAGGTLYTTQYVTSGFSTRQIKSWSIATPSTPSLLQSLQVTTAGEPLGLIVSGNTAFVSVAASGVNAIDLIDVTTPSAMTNITTITPSFTLGSGMIPAVSGNFLFIPSGGDATRGGAIDFYDITTRTTPVKIASTYTNVGSSVFGSIAISNGYIYAGDYGVSPGSSGNLDVFSTPVFVPDSRIDDRIDHKLQSRYSGQLEWKSPHNNTTSFGSNGSTFSDAQ